ncbi:MAG: hypothetical protein GY760_16000 [Deltaproteobacteria bacterium]|nr:hypothetical protein [Deltaproteobacteria bacterium]
MPIFNEGAISKIIGYITGKSDKKSKDLLFKIHENLTRSSSPNTTPRDTGFAVNNWLASADKPRTDTTEGPGESSNSVLRVAGSIEMNKKLYLANNVQYISALNNGHSQQQPVPGWVERALKEAKKDV